MERLVKKPKVAVVFIRIMEIRNDKRAFHSNPLGLFGAREIWSAWRQLGMMR